MIEYLKQLKNKLFGKEPEPVSVAPRVIPINPAKHHRLEVVCDKEDLKSLNEAMLALTTDGVYYYLEQYNEGNVLFNSNFAYVAVLCDHKNDQLTSSYFQEELSKMFKFYKNINR